MNPQKKLQIVQKHRDKTYQKVEAIMRLTSGLTINRAMQTAAHTSTIVSNEETLLKNENGSNVHWRTQPRKDDEVFLNPSKLWFENNANDPQDHQRKIMIVKQLILKTIYQVY